MRFIAQRYRRRLDAIHADHTAIARSALLIAALTMVTKLVVAGREVAIAYRYGVGDVVDAYQLSLTIVTWLPMMLISVMTVVFVPRLVALRTAPTQRHEFVNELNGAILIAGLAITAMIAAFAPEAAKLLASTDSAATVRLTSQLARCMAPVALFVLASGYLSARLQAAEKFSYTITEAAPALCIIASVGVLLQTDGAKALLIGSLLGYALQAGLLVLLVRKGNPPLGTVAFSRRSTEWSLLYGSVLIMSLGQVLIAGATPIDQAFAARIGTGAVATLGYGTRVLALLSGLASIVIGRALLPVLARTVSAGDLRRGRRQVLQWAGLTLFGGIVTSALLWTFARVLVQLLFERGAFGPQATGAVAAAIRLGAVQLPFFYAGIVLVQWYAANARFRDILFITGVGIAVKVAANLFLANTLGVPGLMLSTAMMYATTTGLMLAMIDRSRASPNTRLREDGYVA